MTQKRNSSRSNGHAGPHDRPNGHAPASTERGGVPLQACTAGAQQGLAASDDASGLPVASAAASPAAAGTARQAYAEVAPPPPPDKEQLLNAILAKPTDKSAMEDGATYVDAVAARVDLVAASVRLLSSDDEKIAKAELDRLREMKFGKVGPAANTNEIPTVVWDVPGVSPLKNER